MAAIMKTELSFVKLNRLFHQLTLTEMESTSGGNTFIPLWSSNYGNIIGDDLDKLIGPYLLPLGFYNNKILTIDFSNTDVYLVV
ncbi:hypothetical protein H6G06_25825 [Anabaena sphaerica FACHB-251]|uniref:Uncharacterized protein n=1 Tax=Anabaena sphaerica FACHB-251 TaxID=2692883 RepID=A0A926WLH3_9NOST|nr:hypothetical protein [Anabaena sphaerica]MBD2296805.1 hypothetical protein [Anabaena sphaerica FACHB-251]